ncbi:MAG: prolipoprotein diacylglyceryl transferase [Cyclobacteriaceae bacterium]|nr:prolipoprotein diacylglyceryl transferase [Cyclobacteriaceae bacterium]
MSLFNFIIWSPNPEIFSGIDIVLIKNIRWYGLLFASGFIISQQLMYWVFKTEGKPEKDVDSLTLWMIISTIIGARLGHVLFYEPARYLRDPISILKTWEGGLASHGATIGILTAIYLYVHYYVDINPFKGKFIWKRQTRPGQSYLWVVDRIVICVAISGALIRMGNFVNGEIIGIPTRSNYGVVFATDVEDGIKRIKQVENVNIIHDDSRQLDDNGYVPVSIEITFGGEVNSEEMASKITSLTVKNILSTYEYEMLHIYEPVSHAMDYSIRKSGDGRLQAVVNTYGISRHPAQLYESISTFVLFLLLLFIWYKRKQALPEGLLFGWFLVILFGLRFVYEFVKENQVEFEDSMQLNMGQILSIPLVIAGILILLNLKKLQPKVKNPSK